VEFEQLGEIYRFHENPTHGFYLMKNVQQEWQPLYTFKIEPALPIDIEMANFYTSNSSQHIFRDAILGTRMTAQGRVTLSDHTFKYFDLSKGTLETKTVTEFVPYLRALEKYLGVQLSASEQARFEARFPALKPPVN
jgi:N-hydroxyarylamine O-acetyltransferase